MRPDPRPSPQLVRAVMVTAELTSTALSEPAARVLVADLARYPEAQVLRALERCRRELPSGRKLTVSEIVLRLDDGRPTAEEAWAMIPRDERRTVVWTEEMVTAWGVALPLLAEGEPIPARMAFRDAYLKACAEAKDAGRPVRWQVSPGTDAQEREAVIVDAVARGRLEPRRAVLHLPGYEVREGALQRLPEVDPIVVLAEARRRALPPPAVEVA